MSAPKNAPGIMACCKYSAVLSKAGIICFIDDDIKRLHRGLAGPASLKLLFFDELGFVPLCKTGAELLFEVFSQR